MTTMIASDVLQRLPDSAELDARIVAAFAVDAKSADVSRLLPEVEAAANAADAAAGEARARALDPLLSRDEVLTDRLPAGNDCCLRNTDQPLSLDRDASV